MPLILLMPVLKAIFSPVWGLLKSLWATELGRICIVGTVCLLVGWLKGYAYADLPAAIAKAEKARDLHWTQQIEKASNDHKRELQEALDEASKVAPVDPTRDARVKLCRDRTTGADCREHGQRM